MKVVPRTRGRRPQTFTKHEISPTLLDALCVFSIRAEDTLCRLGVP
jgi:hypothetical protein